MNPKRSLKIISFKTIHTKWVTLIRGVRLIYSSFSRIPPRMPLPCHCLSFLYCFFYLAREELAQTHTSCHTFCGISVSTRKENTHRETSYRDSVQRYVLEILFYKPFSNFCCNLHLSLARDVYISIFFLL